ncbi:hypothetical protein ABW20_dc0100553 [Dactylellina cionopaga]|nr:hypothetical protein ABW20_dc0100553 [Dactylellina cionopaga]
MLPADALETSVSDIIATKEDEDLSTRSGKLKRPAKSSVLAKKSTNMPSLATSKSTLKSKGGKITGKVTKASTTNLKTKKVTTKDTDSFDIFTIPLSPTPSPLSPPRAHKGLESLLETPPRETDKLLDPYIPAKRIWTPVKENSQPTVIDLCTPDDIAKATSTASFTSLLSLYKHDGVSTVTSSFTSIGNNEPLTKRRRIEVVGIPNLSEKSKEVNGKEESSSKSKPRKSKAKKPKTITGLAIAPYITAEPEPTPTPVSEQSKKAEVEKAKVDKLPVKRKRKSQASDNTSKSPKTKKIVAKPPPTASILSPQSARKRMDAQTFIFDTSSQLLKSNPPGDGWALETTGKKLNTIQTHAKILSKATYDLDGFSDVDDLELNGSWVSPVEEPVAITTECTADTTGWGISELEIIKATGKRSDNNDKNRSLWSVASRGFSGGLLDIPVLDLIDEDDFDLSQKFSSQKLDPEIVSLEVPKELIKAPAEKVLKASNARTMGPPKKKDLSATHRAELPAAISQNPKIETAVKEKSKENKLESTSTVPGLPDRPNFEGYTLVQLQTQIKKYGFKPVKSRKTMIDMLNQCWDSAAVTAASQEPVVNIKASTKGGKKKQQVEEGNEGTAEVLPKKRGRKPKTAIETTDEDETPKTKKPKKSSTTSRIKAPLDTTTLFKHIAAAIKHQPISSKLNDPSWWQRILMNETIVLEEFAEWLVETGMKATGPDNGFWVNCGVCENVSEGLDGRKLDAVRSWCDARDVSYI